MPQSRVLFPSFQWHTVQGTASRRALSLAIACRQSPAFLALHLTAAMLQSKVCTVREQGGGRRYSGAAAVQVFAPRERWRQERF